MSKALDKRKESAAPKASASGKATPQESQAGQEASPASRPVQASQDPGVDFSAPLETPESSSRAAASGSMEDHEATDKLETPESPVAPPSAEPVADSEEPAMVLGDPVTPGLGTPVQSLTTYGIANNINSPATMTALDSGVGGPVASRVSVFTPPGSTLTSPPPLASLDTGTASQMAARPDVFEPPQTQIVYIDPGAI